MSLPERRIVPTVGEVVRTPESCFKNVVGYDWPVHEVTVGAGLQMVYVDAGPSDAKETMFLLHGEPMWGYLYHKMVAPLVAAGYRVIVPDLIGFGRSDKPLDTNEYTYERHVAWMNEWLNKNDFRGMTFIGQDWGGLVGLRVVTANVDRFDRICIGNTGLPTYGREPTAAFRDWQKFSKEVPVFEVGKMVRNGSLTKLSPEVIAAYDAPFPDESFKAAARIFPSLYPDGEDHPSNIANKIAWDVLRSWTKPFLTAFGSEDPIAFKPGAHLTFQTRVPGAAGLTHHVIEGANHFIQEDAPAELVTIIHNFAQ